MTGQVRSGGLLHTREQLFAILFPALAINSAATIALQTVQVEGLVAATLNLWGISAVLWLAGIAGLHLLLTASDTASGNNGGGVRRADWMLAITTMVAMVLPSPALSGVALTTACLWVIASSPSDALRRASFIYMAITGSLLWGRLLLSMGSGVLLSLDGWMVGQVAGTGGSGNLVTFTGRSGDFIVAPGCSSLQGISIAMVLWVTATQFHSIALTRRAWLTLLAMVAAAIASNILRLTAIARFPAHFDTLHVGLGATAFGWIGLVAIVAALWIGLGHALRS